MAFYVIEQQPVFLHTTRYDSLRKEALEDSGATFRVASRIHGFPEAEEADGLVYNLLRTKHQMDPQKFTEEWVKFDLVQEEATESVWDLLYDYCVWWGHAQLVDLRDFKQQLVDSYTSDTLAYPQGSVFALDHFVKPKKWYWKYTKKMRGRTLRLVVVANRVSRLVGDLTDFTIITKDFCCRCREDLTIHPSGS